jgi:hypothetical protein
VTPASAARRSALLLAVVAVALVALTPVGVWIAATVGGWFAEGAGWRLEAAHHGGSLATTARWRDLRLANDGLGLQVEASQLSLSPWSWAVDLHEPQITWDLPADTSAVSTEEAGGDTLRLPVADLPQIVVTGASLRLQAADSLAVTIDDADLQLQASASGEAAARERQVTWSVASWSLAAGSTRIDGETSGQARLRSTDVSLRDLFLRVASGEARGTLRGRADLSLAPTLDVETELTLEGQTAQAAGLWADVLAAGALRPLDLGLTINGGGEVDGIGPVETHVVARIDTTGGSADSLSLHVAGGHAGGRLSWRSADGWIEAAAELKELALTTLTGGALSGPLSGRVEWRGAVEAPEATVDVRSAAIGGLSAEPIDLDLSARLQGSDLTARARSDRLGQLEAAGSLRLTEPSADLRLSGRLDAAPWLGHSWPLSTRGTLRSGADAERLSVRLTAGALPFGESPPGPVMADVELTDWRHLQVKVGVDRGQLAGWARLDLATTTLDTLRLGADAVGLAGLSGALRGNLTGQVAGSGDLAGVPTTALSLQVDDLGWGAWSAGPARLSAWTDSGRVVVDAGAEGLDLQARLDTSGALQATAELDGATLRSPSSRVVLSGRARAVAPALALDSARAEVRLDSARADLDGWIVALSAGLAADYDRGRATLSAARFESPFGQVRMQGWLSPDSVAFAARLDTITTEGFQQVRAGGSLRLDVEGSLDEPRTRLQLSLTSLELGGRPLGALVGDIDLSDSLRAAVEMGTPEAPALMLSLRAPSADFQPRGLPDGSELARLHVVANRLDASTVATWALEDSTGLTASLEADVTLPARQLLSGLEWQELRGFLELTELTVDRDRVRLRLQEPARADLALGGLADLQGFRLPVEVYRRDTESHEPAGEISLDGRLAGDGGRLTLRVADLQLEAAAKALPGRVSLPAGELSLQVNLTGTAQEPALDATAAVDLELLGRVTGRVFGRPRSWDARALWLSPIEDSLHVTASAPAQNIWPRWDELTVRARSAGFDLLPLLDQVPELETLSGVVRVDVTADSLSTDPRLTGAIDVEGLEFSLLDVRPGYVFPEGRILFGERDAADDSTAAAGTHARLDGFDGTTTSGAGRLQLQGFVDLLPGWATDYDIRLTGTDVRYDYDDVFTAPDIDLELALRKGGEGSLLEGSVRLNKPYAETQLVDLAAPPVPPPPTVQNAFLESTRLNVYVDIEQLETRSELSDITLDGQTRVYGTFYQPRFQGELEITEGEVILLNRQFTFTRGRIVLDRLVPTYSILDLIYDPILLDPELDLEATTTVQPRDDPGNEVEVTLSLQGPVRGVAPRLTAPGYGDTEVLNLLAFGSTTTTDANYASALATAAGQLLLSRRVQRVGLDEFLLLPSGTALGTVGRSAVRVGKFLSWPLPMWVRYEANTTEVSTGQFEVEYRITTWMTIDATAYSEYELYGVGLGLSREF